MTRRPELSPAPQISDVNGLAFGPRFASENGGLFLRVDPGSNDFTLCIKVETQGLPAQFSMFPTNGVGHFLIHAHKGARIAFSAGATTTQIKGLKGWLFWAQGLIRGNQVTRLSSGAARVQAIGYTKKNRRLIRKSLRAIASVDLGAGNCYVSESAAMVLGLQSLGTKPQLNASSPSIRIGVVVHLHYADVWTDLAASLLHIPEPFGLIVTITERNPALELEIISQFHFADIRLTANVGRDVRPFIELLDDGALDAFDVVCKIHGKKTLQEGKASALGKLWLRSALLELLVHSGRFYEIIDRFQSAPTLGLLGSERLRIPNRRAVRHDAWGGNERATLELVQILGLKNFELDFFAGTMFWVRPHALADLRGKALGDVSSYTPEAGKSDGALEHSLERLFSAAARSAGFEVASVGAALDVVVR